MSIQAPAFGRYSVDEIVGTGGMAVVHRGHDAELDRVVAVKLLADNLASDDNFRERFVREGRLAARLAHPNVVHVFDAGEEDGRPFIVMEYVDGETLADRLAREGRLDPYEAVALGAHAAAGLSHAHDRGLVHRDVKPQNLLLGNDGTLKIADFGIARSAHGTQLTEVGSVIGTAAYLAPEQAAGEEVTAAADVYALGVVLYEMLSGHKPYTYETLSQLLVGHHDQPIPAIRDSSPTVPPDVEEIVMRCLARLPQYRPQAAALAAALVAALPDAPTLPHGTGQSSEAVTRLSGVAARIPALDRRARPARRLPDRATFTNLSVNRIVALAVVTLIALGLLLAIITSGGGDGGGAVPRTRPNAKPAVEQARDLSAWLRSHTAR